MTPGRKTRGDAAPGPSHPRKGLPESASSGSRSGMVIDARSGDNGRRALPCPSIDRRPRSLAFAARGAALRGRRGQGATGRGVRRRDVAIVPAPEDHLRGDRSITMQLGLIADIHADHHALEDALRLLDGLGVATILCAGDVVGYGAHADAVVDLLRERAIPCIRGNHDRWALERRQVIGVRGWTGAELSESTWEYLRGLPTSLRVAGGGRPIAVYHGSPAGDTEFVTPYKAIPESVEKFWDESDAEVLVLGHSHIPMVERTPRGTIINPGSVLGVSGVQSSSSFAVVELDELAVRWHEVRTGRELRRDPIFLGDGENANSATD